MTERITMDVLRSLAKADAKEWLDSLTQDEVEALFKDWSFMARGEQLAPAGDWANWIYLAGRGAGKTRTGAEWVRSQVKQGFMRGGLIAPTAGDVRDVMVEGESGILAISFANDLDDKGRVMGKPLYEPSKRRLTWMNGAQCALYSADEPERLRGPQHEYLWADELCAWRRPETWDLAMFGLRLGKNPQSFISTTPKPKKIIIDLMKDPSTVTTRGTTYDNRANLAGKFFDQVVKKYEGTRLGKQELMGILLEEAEGALWSRPNLDETRLNKLPGGGFYFKRIAVAVDPAITAKSTSDETGITVAGLGSDDHGYVLADYSGRYSPADWAKKVDMAWKMWQADVVIAEGNQGGEMVKHTIQTQNKNINVQIVHASRGKAARAEPVAALFEQKRCHLVGNFNEMEDQLCVWEPLSGDESPDRLDSVVWGLTALMIGKGEVGQGVIKGAY